MVIKSSLVEVFTLFAALLTFLLEIIDRTEAVTDTMDTAAAPSTGHCSCQQRGKPPGAAFTLGKVFKGLHVSTDAEPVILKHHHLCQKLGETKKTPVKYCVITSYCESTEEHGNCTCTLFNSSDPAFARG